MTRHRASTCLLILALLTDGPVARADDTVDPGSRGPFQANDTVSLSGESNPDVALVTTEFAYLPIDGDPALLASYTSTTGAGGAPPYQSSDGYWYWDGATNAVPGDGDPAIDQYVVLVKWWKDPQMQALEYWTPVPVSVAW
jgi:hypothetical protein